MTEDQKSQVQNKELDSHFSKVEKTEILKYCRGIVTDWQKFAEQKVYLLLTITSATIFASVTIIGSYLPENSSWELMTDYIVIPLVILAISSLISFVYSFLGIKVSLKDRSMPLPEKDVLKWLTHWGQISELGNSGFETIRSSFQNYSRDEFHDDLISDLLIGSNLTFRKYKHFNGGLYIYLTGITLATIAFIILIFL